MIAAPGIGRRSLANGWISRNILSRGNVGTPFSKGEIELYVDSFREPSRADAITHLYRYYQRVLREGVTSRRRSPRLSVPTLLLFGERDRYLSKRLLDGHEGHADALRIELVPDSGHFLVDERPDLVIERAREFLGG